LFFPSRWFVAPCFLLSFPTRRSSDLLSVWDLKFAGFLTDGLGGAISGCWPQLLGFDCFVFRAVVVYGRVDEHQRLIGVGINIYEIGRAHVLTPVTFRSRMPSSA